MKTPRVLLLLILPVALFPPGVVAEESDAAAPDLARALAVRKVRVIRDAELIVVAAVKEVHQSPGIWCGILATRQEVTYRVVESVYGDCADDENIRVGHLLVGGNALVSGDAPFLRPSVFYPGARFLLCLNRTDGKWTVRDESFGASPIDPPKKAAPVRTELLRQVLLLPELLSYFHPEEEGRVPVKVVLGRAFPVAPKLTVLGRRVQFVPAYLLRGDPHLRVTSIQVEEKQATIRFAYDAEGVIGEARFIRENGRYRMAWSKVAER